MYIYTYIYVCKYMLNKFIYLYICMHSIHITYTMMELSDAAGFLRTLFLIAIDWLPLGQVNIIFKDAVNIS